MNRRKFLSLGVGAVAASLLPAADLLAETKPALPDVFAIAGCAKSGKSLLAAELAVARAGGCSTFLGRFSVTQGRTLCLDNQHRASTILHRFARIAAPFDFEKLDVKWVQHIESMDLRRFVDDVAAKGFKHVIVDSMSIFDGCTYDYRDEAGVSFTKPLPFDREFRRHAGEGVFTDLLRERGITCVFTCSQNTEVVTDGGAAFPLDDERDERHETRDAIVIDGVRIFHGPVGIRHLHGRGAFAKSFAPTGEPHRLNTSLRFERVGEK